MKREKFETFNLKKHLTLLWFCSLFTLSIVSCRLDFHRDIDSLYLDEEIYLPLHSLGITLWLCDMQEMGLQSNYNLDSMVANIANKHTLQKMMFWSRKGEGNM